MTTDDIDVARLRAALRGQLVVPGDRTYDLLRRPFNARIDPHPVAIARCADEDDVIAAVRFATDLGLPVTCRSGGHGAEGWCSITGQLVIDLSAMQQVEVDLDAEVVHVSGGTRWGQVDLATYPWGYATPGGGCVDVGVAGLTQGGGVGPIARTWGMTSDNLLSARVVTSRDRDVVVANAETNPDLFWALRGGGGGNFGAVTRFTYRLRPIGGALLGGMMMFGWDDMEKVWAFYRDWMNGDDDRRLSMSPMVFFNPDNTPGCGLTAFYNGHPDDGLVYVTGLLDEAGLQPLQGPVSACLEKGTLPAYTGTESTTSWPGTGQYWRSGFLRNDFSAEAIATIKSQFEACPLPPGREPVPPTGTGRQSDLSFAFIEGFGGAIAEVPRADTAFWWRDQNFSFTIIAVYDPADDDWAGATRDWAMGFRAAMEPHLSGAVYANYVQADLEDFGRAYHGEHYPRLREVKRTYDPTHVFRFPQDLS